MDMTGGAAFQMFGRYDILTKCVFLVVLKGTDDFINLGVEVGVILKCFLRKFIVWMWNGLR